MKKIVLLITTIAFLIPAIHAQNDQRTTSTRIADLLAQMPAKNDHDFQTAMKEMEKLGEDGLYQLSQQMVPAGKADNSHLEYAVMGFTSYSSANGMNAQRNMAESAWIRAVNKTEDKNLKSFFMSMLEIIGTDRSVPTVSAYLKDKDLNKKAASVLAAIRTDAAGLALLDALKQHEAPEAALLALGEMRFAPAAGEINAYVTKGTAAQKAAALFAIAEIGDLSSRYIIKEQALARGKSFQNQAATALYGRYISRLAENGQKKEAATLAHDFMKAASGSDVATRIAALNAVVATDSDAALRLLAAAAYDSDLEYRNAALAMARPLVNSSNISLFTKKFKKAPPAVQLSLVHFLSDQNDKSALNTIRSMAKNSREPELRDAALLAIAKSGGASATRDILNVLQTSSDNDTRAVAQALLLVKDENAPSTILSEMEKMSEPKRVLLLGVLSEKRTKEAFPVVAAAMKSTNPSLKKAAFDALPNVSGAQSLPQLFAMLQAADNQDEMAVIQQAIISALQNEKAAEETVVAQWDKMPAEKQQRLFPVLSSVGSAKALKIVYDSYQKNTGAKSDAAFDALASWPDPDAMDILFTIASDAKEKKKEAALLSYINLIKKYEAPQEQKLLLLQKAMEASTTTAERLNIIDQAAQITTFPSLAFTAKYLDDPALKQRAAGAVMNIGLSNKSFYGTLVRQWLTKAMHTIEGQDDVYMKKSIQKFLDDMPDKEGYVSIFNGKDLTGWKGLVENPIARRKMTKAQLAAAQIKADSLMRRDWKVVDGDLVFVGSGFDNIATVKDYGDIEMLIDWKIFDDGHKDGDAGIYLRGTPQVQMWDTSRTNVGAQVGSGGLYNNQKHESKPLKVADNKLGEWNHFYIKMIGDKVTVYLNGELVTDNVPLENYWDRNLPLWAKEQIELQAHGSRIGYREIYVKELDDEKPFELSEDEKKEGFQVLFDGSNMDQWMGNLTDYVIEDGNMVVRPRPGSRGNLYSKKEYADFAFRFEFKLTPGANNGVGIRTPVDGDPAYVGMEIQILDNDADIYKNLEKYQYHGSVYGVIPAKRGFLKPVGEWNYQEIIARGDKIRVILNGETILDGDIRQASKNGTADGQKHPGLLNKKGHIGFLGHGSVVSFRNIRVKEL